MPFATSAARTARHHLSAFLHDQHLAQQLMDDALVVISELVTNAVRHATPQQDGGSTRLPGALSADNVDEVGRGLSIVSTLTRRWWVEAHGSDVRVSALLDAG